ncbi:DUF6449 domain-containing protein [Salipaludibacillus daqingensis]|uniref:DUF6449 domain-containing protein n=1 Tax=Salipaludibacillus daqingensis TaxID=3041001 RepID=UPI0024759E7E|nr:DUF6449 domain-containing protein [Salipaludibacillus daqingensis]
MKSKILLWNKALFNLQLRTVSWFSILLTLLLFVMIPISILVQEIRFGPGAPMNYHLGTGSLNALSEFSFPVQLIVFAIFPVIIGIILLNFSTKKEATYFMHSLPFTRQSILTNTYIAGIVALLSPIFLTGIAVGILRFFLEDPFYSYFDLLAWVGISTFIILFLFLVTMTIGIFVGNGLLHGVLTYTVIIVPALLIVLTLTNLQYFISGLALTSYTETLITKGIFFYRLVDLRNVPFTIFEYVIYIFIAGFLVFLSYVMYAKRSSEASDQAIVFPVVRSIFLYGLTFFAMLIGGLYFTEALQGGFAWTMLGYLVGAFIAYTVLQMILQKSFRLSWPWKGFVGYVAAIILLMIPINIGGAAYENNIPNVEDVESVAIYSSYSYGIDDTSEAPRLVNQISIEQVTDVHQKLITYEDNDIKRWNTVTIDYALKDGSTLRREYSLNDSFGRETTEELRNNDEFKKAYDPVFQLRDLDITYASIFQRYGGDGDTRITDEDQLNTLISLLEEDLANIPSQMLVEENRSYIGELYFNTSSNRHDHYFMLNEDYQQTLEWLKKNDYNDSLLTSENITSVYVVRSTGDDFFMEIDEMMYSTHNISDNFPNAFETSDKNEINELLDIGTDYYHKDYVIIIEGINDYPIFLGFDSEDAPDFMGG